MLAPGDGVGLTILANADWKHVAIKEIGLALMRKAFGIPDSEHTHFDDVTGHGIKTRQPVERSEAAGLPEHDFTGVYVNEGYGSFVLCNSTSTSHYCTQVLSDFAVVDGASAAKNKESELYAEWPRYWSSHLRLAHRSGLRFTLQPTALFPKGYSKDTRPFETYEGDFGDFGDVEFVDRDGAIEGLGMFLKTGREKMEGSIEERADVWFVRG
jgi:hypothetical protein